LREDRAHLVSSEAIRASLRGECAAKSRKNWGEYDGKEGCEEGQEEVRQEKGEEEVVNQRAAKAARAVSGARNFSTRSRLLRESIPADVPV
jgi:hypothetical protein